MKKLLFLVVILLGLGLVSCKDTKKVCNCKTTVEYSGDMIDEDPFFENMNSDVEQIATIEDGECSDINSTTKSNMMGMVMTTITTCIEQ